MSYRTNRQTRKSFKLRRDERVEWECLRCGHEKTSHGTLVTPEGMRIGNCAVIGCHCPGWLPKVLITRKRGGWIVGTGAHGARPKTEGEM